MATTLVTGTSTGIATNRSVCVSLRRATVVIALVPALLLAVPCAAAEVGPDNGVLVIVGGAAGPEILKLFAELAGGADAPLVVIPTANGNPPYDDLHEAARFFREQAGVKDVVVIHTDDREKANSEAFVEPIGRARGVWFPGGRQWRLADSYLGTRTQRALEALLARGGVIGGSSAGATILGSYLARGDTENNTVMMGDHEEGFGFLRNTAIDQHLLRRNRQFDLIEVIEARPELLGIGLDENTGIVVRGDRFRVIGESYVAIYDHGRRMANGGRFYFLSPGDFYDLKERAPMRRVPSSEPFSKVKQEASP